MAVIFAAVGVSVAIALSHEDYSAHNDYSDYSDYSDAEERKRRRLAALKVDAEAAAIELSIYKRSFVNPELDSQALKNCTAMRISESEMDTDARAKIQRRIEQDVQRETEDLHRELRLVDDILDKISRLEKEN